MQRRYNAGVTLIELMVVVVIIGILASIAYPSYRQYAMRANRTEAKTTLLQLTQSLERCYTQFHVYNHANCTVDTTISLDQYEIAPKTGVPVAATTYVLEATPKGGQTDDKTCGTLSIDQVGRQLPPKGSDGRPCW